ncbi:MAG: hypothetical protein GWP08_16315 [Nitrospiraceae bacterium]|nr:hypothetical protein [Nitrospiraceae bacterium]
MNNKKFDHCDTLEELGCFGLLAREGIEVPGARRILLGRFLDLIGEWNAFASLVSRGDLDHLAESHLADALSLASIVRAACGEGGRLLDVGSGGGFPAIPLKVVLPDLRLTMVERSTKKVGFLRKAFGALGLGDVELIQGGFPGQVSGEGVRAVTARAVEKPGRILRDMQRFMPEGSVFLCQSGDPGAEVSERFHVERVEDAWTEAGLRRGELYLVRRVA